MKSLKSQRLHIGIFGKTNVGKSSLINKITGQDISIVSEIAGTTTDVVEKSMELLPIGAVNFLDTAGIDDKSSLGSERINKTLKIINRVDIAVIVCDYNGIDEYENGLIEQFKNLNIPFFTVVNKIDLGNIEKNNYEKIK
jgi:small GTP-binding protein